MTTAIEEADKLNDRVSNLNSTLHNSQAVIASRIATLEPRHVQLGFSNMPSNRIDDTQPRTKISEVNEELKFNLHLRDVLEGQDLKSCIGGGCDSQGVDIEGFFKRLNK